MDKYLSHGVAPGGECKGGTNMSFRKFRIIFQNFFCETPLPSLPRVGGSQGLARRKTVPGTMRSLYCL
jgi:hypothetical protein